MKCTLIGCNENMSLPRLSLSLSLSLPLFAQRKKLSDNQTKLKIKSREIDETTTGNSTAAIIITITRVRHRMWAKRKTCMRRLYCSLSASFRFVSLRSNRSSLAALAFIFSRFACASLFRFILYLRFAIQFVFIGFPL